MKLYFDHRNFTGIYVNIFVNGESFGCCYLNKNKITVIELPESIEMLDVYYSFAKFDGCKKAKRIVCEEALLPKRKTKLSLADYKVIDEKWRFPYYCSIDVKNCNEDIIFFPAIFSEDELKGVFYYQVYTCSGEKYVNVTMKKDFALGQELKKERCKQLIMNFIASIVSMITIYFSAYQIVLYDLTSYQTKGVIKFLILGVVFMPICLIKMLNSYRYSGMINFSRIHDEIEL